MRKIEIKFEGVEDFVKTLETVNPVYTCEGKDCEYKFELNDSMTESVRKVCPNCGKAYYLRVMQVEFHH